MNIIIGEKLEKYYYLLLSGLFSLSAELDVSVMREPQYLIFNLGLKSLLQLDLLSYQLAPFHELEIG